jgi:hypothetical protein
MIKYKNYDILYLQKIKRQEYLKQRYNRVMNNYFILR